MERKEWLKAEIEELINMYHGKPELWDIKSNVYKDRVKKHNAFTEMAEILGTTTDEIQRKIHNLRNQFNSEFKKTRTTKSGQSTDELYISKWPYYNLLLFLQGGSACKPAKGNLPMDAAVEEAANENKTSDNQNTWEQPEEVNRSDFTPISAKNEINSKKKRKIEVSKNDLLVEKAIFALNEQEDQYDVFGKYVASEMRTLSSEYLRKKMKRKFQQIILEINEEDELLSNPVSHSYSNPNSVASVGGYFDSSSNSEQYINLQSQQTLSYIQTETESNLSPIIQQLP